MNELDQCRREIDEIDAQLLKLFESRMDVVLNVASYKIKHNLPVLNQNRENEVLEKIMQQINNKNYDKYACEFFIELMRISKKMQQELIHHG